MTSVLLLAALAQAPLPEPEVFVDRGETYVRMGFDQGLTKGITLEIISADKHTVIGTAVVMEVWDGLSRVNLDTASMAFKGLRRARQRGAVVPAAATVADPVPPAAAPTMAGKRVLKGKVQISGGAYDVRRVIVTNLDNFDWHDCKVVLADGRSFHEAELKASSDDGIMLFRFEAGEPRDPQNLVALRCREGETRVAVAP
jgi:hypothetical protein